MNSKEISTDLSKFCSYGNEGVYLAQFCEADYPYFYDMNCLDRCPYYTVEFNRTCLLQCPPESALITVNGSNGIELEGHKTCSLQCPSTHPFLFKSTNLMQCVMNCPEFTYMSRSDNECKLQCPKNKPFLLNKTCYTDCPESNRYKLLVYTNYNKIFTCVKECPVDTVYDGTRCVESCPSAKSLFNSTCVLRCPESSAYLYPKYHDGSPNMRNDIKNYGRAKFMCVEECNPKGLPTDENSKNGFYNSRQFHLVSDNVCTPKCPSKVPFEFNGTCHSTCPQSYPLFKPLSRSNKCVNKCDDFYFNSSCLEYCPVHARFIMNDTCAKQCDGKLPYYIKETTIFSSGGYSIICLADCPPSYYYFNDSVCFDICPKEANFEFNKTCLEECPEMHSYFTEISKGSGYKYGPYISHYKCLKTCPRNEFIYKEKKCVQNCPKDRNFIVNDTCSELCPPSSNLKLKTGSHFKCVDICPRTLSYNDVCVEECPKDAKFQVDHTCNDKCSINSPLVNIEYYTKKVYVYWRWQYTKEKRFHCVKSCPSGKFIYNDTDCVLQCPSEVNYASNGTCTKNCSKLQEFKIWKGSFYKCVNACDSALVFNKTCLESCPNEAIFQLNGTCVENCPDGNPYQFHNMTSKRVAKHYCLNECPSGTYNFNLTCVSSCPNTTFTFNSSCLYNCPKNQQTNYTKNGQGSGIYTCVKKCPENTVSYNETCYDICPERLNSHMSVCIADCPASHQFINLQEKMCVNKCPENQVASNDNVCVRNCTNAFPYIEGNRCARKCQHKKFVIEVTSHGRKCYNQCPHHLLLKDNTNLCVEKCPLEMLIVDSVCKKIDSCPFHTYVEHSSIGRRCTNRCSPSFYLDGTKCIKECPKEKVIAGNECLDTCPPNLPLIYKHFSDISPRAHCYQVCPDGYLQNGSICVDEISCSYAYDHVCYQSCPASTVISGYKSCESNVKYIILTIGNVIAVVIMLVVVYFMTWFTGTSEMADSDEDLKEYTNTIVSTLS